ncbi:hypothetical protein [Amycolatopsis thermoflava]|uniref:hypothetical protein n=1 Tax=Amycolatopsis thermoflava TaxID=84480 RepID=UPI003D74D6B0
MSQGQTRSRQPPSKPAVGSWDGTIGLRGGEHEVHLRVYRGRIDYPSLEAERIHAEIKAGRYTGTVLTGLSASTPLDRWAHAWAGDRAAQDG